MSPTEIEETIAVIRHIKGVCTVHEVTTDYATRVAVEHRDYELREILRRHQREIFRELGLTD